MCLFRSGPTPGAEKGSKPVAKMPIRRKLAISPGMPVPGCEGAAPSRCPPGLQELLRQDGTYPLPDTPETRASKAPVSIDPDSTFDVGVDQQGEETAPVNSTIILSPKSSEPPGGPGLSQLFSSNVLRANNSSEVPRR